MVGLAFLFSPTLKFSLSPLSLTRQGGNYVLITGITRAFYPAVLHEGG